MPTNGVMVAVALFMRRYCPLIWFIGFEQILHIDSISDFVNCFQSAYLINCIKSFWKKQFYGKSNSKHEHVQHLCKSGDYYRWHCPLWFDDSRTGGFSWLVMISFLYYDLWKVFCKYFNLWPETVFITLNFKRLKIKCLCVFLFCVCFYTYIHYNHCSNFIYWT